MKLICKKTDGEVKFINPNFVRSVKQTHSNINNDWCIVIEMDDHNVETFLSKTEEESNCKLIEITEVMEYDSNK
jgi:uncharacterized protein (DUF39 family)